MRRIIWIYHSATENWTACFFSFCFPHSVQMPCSLWTCNSKGHYDPLSKFSGGKFAVLEDQKETLLLQLKHAMRVNLWSSACACVRACVRERSGEQLFKKYEQWQNELMKNVKFLHVSFVQGHYQSEEALSYDTKYCNSTGKWSAKKFTAKVSEAHAAARVKGAEAANVENKVCIAAFQRLLSNLPWTQKIAFPLCSASRAATFWKHVATWSAMHTLFSGKGKLYSC